MDEKQPVERIVVTMPEGVTLRGRVVDSDGEPIAGAKIRFSLLMPKTHYGYFGKFSGAGWEMDEAARSDADGRFEIAHINYDIPGRYVITVPSSRQYVPARLLLEPGQREAVIQMEKGASLDGTVVNGSSGKPIAGFSVQAEVIQDPGEHALAVPLEAGEPRRIPLGPLQAEALTDAEGRFHFSNLPESAKVKLSVYHFLYSRSTYLSPQELEAVSGQPEPVRLKAQGPQY